MAQLSPKAVAERYGKATLTVYRWIYRGAIPATKIGGGWFIDEADLKDLPKKQPANHALDEYVQAIVSGAPELTQEQVSQLREALGRRSE